MRLTVVSSGVAPRSMARWKISKRLVDDGELIGVEATEQLPQLALVELAESVRASTPAAGVAVMTTWRRSAGSAVAIEQAELDEPLDDLAGGRRADAEPAGELGHAELTGGHHDVQDLGLGHRHVDLGEFGGVTADEALHQPLVARRGRRRARRQRVVGSVQVKCSVTPYYSV